MSRKLWPVPGGIHPPEHKKLSSENPIAMLPFPERLVLPLSQHIGAPSFPIVRVGEQVLANQVIAEADGVFSVPVHASTSGTVTAIGPHPIPHPSGLSAPCISIEPDRAHTELERQGFDDFRNQSRETLLSKIRDCGVAGMGGAGFPTDIKLNPRGPKTIDTLIVNGVECEPYITADDRLMRENPEDVVNGITILSHLLDNPASCIIAVEDNKPEAIAALRRAAAGTSVEIVELPTQYPSGGEKQLIRIITGRRLPPGSLPSDSGVVVQNITTTVAVHRAISCGKPLFARVTTVTGHAVARPGNYKVLLGTPVNHLLQSTGFDPEGASRVVMGGPMMGFTIGDARVPIVKTSNCILATSLEEMPPPPPAQPCIRCSRCVQVCPMQLLPQQLYRFAREQNLDQLHRHNLMDCIECGSCAYTCTSNIPLVQYFRAAKGEVHAVQREQQAADQARRRREAREARHAAKLAEKEAMRARRNAGKAGRTTAALPENPPRAGGPES